MKATLSTLFGTALFSLGATAVVAAGEQQIVLRDYISQDWRNELLAYPFAPPERACHPGSVTLTGPAGPVPVQISAVEFWPDTEWVKSAQIAFIASLAPLASDTYTVRYGTAPEPAVAAGETDLRVVEGQGQAEIATRQFGVRLALGEKLYPDPVEAAAVPGPVAGMRLADGTWFGGSRLSGPNRIAGWSARLTDRGPVFARVAVRYTYASGNTFELTVQVAAGDNALRMDTRVEKSEPQDGFDLILSRGLPPLVFQVQDESREDRDCFRNRSNATKSYHRLDWAEIPLANYTAPEGKPEGLVTQLTPWEDWFGTFTQTRIRLKLENTTRELQIRSLDAGAWVEPRALAAPLPGVRLVPAAAGLELEVPAGVKSVKLVAGNRE